MANRKTSNLLKLVAVFFCLFTGAGVKNQNGERLFASKFKETRKLIDETPSIEKVLC